MLGPMAPSLAGVRAFARAVLAARPWRRDPLCVRKPWSAQEHALAEHGGRGARLCVALMCDNGVIKPHPPLFRALRRARAALEAAGHTGEHGASAHRSARALTARARPPLSD